MEDVARDLKNLQTEHTKLRQQFSEMTSDLESVRRDAKQKQLMIDELNENVGDLTKRSQDAEKSKKKSEMEKEELANQLEVMPSQCVPTRTRSFFQEAEAALETEEGKVLKNQLEFQQLQQEMAKRLAEKDEETEEVR